MYVMTDDSDSEHTSEESLGEGSETDRTRMDEFLDRFEETLQSEPTAPDQSTANPHDPANTVADTPHHTAADSTDSRANGTDDSTDNSTDKTVDDSTDDSTADVTDGGRLWDRFSTDPAPTEPTSSTEPSRTATDYPSADHSSADGSSGNHSSADHSSTDHTSTDLPPGGEAGPDATQTPDDQHDTPSGSDSAASASTSSTDSENATSFRSILSRISNRVGSLTGDEPAASADAQPAADAAATQQTSAASSSSAGDESTGDRSSTAGVSGVAGGTEHSQSERIRQVLHNIDLFGRATSSSQVLVLSPTGHSMTNETYRQFLLPDDGSGQNVLFVSAIQSASNQLSTVRNIPNWVDGETAVIEVGQGTLQSGSAAGGDLTAQLDIYKRISNLQNLAKLGVNISHIVSQWDATHRPTVVGIHTLSSIQQYVGNETMFQFLFTLKGQLNSMGVMGLYHMDPAVHSEPELATIQEAFDIVVTISPDGTVNID